MDTFILAVLSWPAYSAGWPNCHDSGRAERLSQLTGGVSPSATPSDTGGRLADPMPAGDTGPLCTTSDPARGVAWGGVYACRHRFAVCDLQYGDGCAIHAAVYGGRGVFRRS